MSSRGRGRLLSQLRLQAWCPRPRPGPARPHLTPEGEGSSSPCALAGGPPASRRVAMVAGPGDASAAPLLPAGPLVQRTGRPFSGAVPPRPPENAELDEQGRPGDNWWVSARVPDARQRELFSGEPSTPAFHSLPSCLRTETTSRDELEKGSRELHTGEWGWSFS